MEIRLLLAALQGQSQSRPKSHTFSVILAVFAPQPRWRQKPWKGLLRKGVESPNCFLNFCSGANNDGDIFNEDNLTEFRRFVWESTDNKGVHFVMADGVGISLVLLLTKSALHGQRCNSTVLKRSVS